MNTRPGEVHALVEMSSDEQIERLHEVAGRALHAYDLQVAQITPVRFINNAVFKVQARRGVGTYALRVHRAGYRSVAQTRTELRYLEGLRRDTGLAVPEPVRMRDGDVVTLVDWDGSGQQRHCDLLTWLEGAVRRPGSGLGRKGVERIGAFLGRMHEYADRFTPAPEFDLPRWDAAGLLTSKSPYHPGDLHPLFSPDDRAAFELLHARLQAVFHVLGDGRDQFGVIHADFILGNCLFHGRSLRVLDFDDCGWGYFLYDMAPLIGNLKDFDCDGSLVRAFLAGYRSVRRLPDEHEQYLDLLVAVRDAASALWAAGRIRSGDMSPDLRRSMAENIAHRMAEVQRYLKQG